ncbi:MAG: c-type cytochrome [Candidatus Methylomirabilales bacterium]
MKRPFLGVVIFTILVLLLFVYVGEVLTRISGEEARVEKEKTRLLGGAVEVSPEVGREIFWGRGRCHTCHSVGSEGSAIRGPNLGEPGPTGLPIGVRAVQRAKERSGQTGKQYTRTDYLIESMVEPKAYLVEGYSGIMPVIYRPPIALSPDEIKAVATYLQSIGGEVDVAAITKSPFLKKVKVVAAAPAPEGLSLLLEGDPEMGESLFFDPESPAGCAKCHTVKDKGGKVGPELTTVAAAQPLDYIIESILKPSAVIVTGFEPTLIITKDGRYVTGIMKREDDQVIELADSQGQIQKVRKADVKEQVPQEVSIMPENFGEILTVQDLHDLLAFLETLK